MSLQKVLIKWGQLNVQWGAINLTWSEIYTYLEIAKGSGAGGIIVDPEKVWSSVDADLKQQGYDKDTREKFLKVVVKVNGLETDSSRKMESIKKSITVDHIKNTIAKVTPEVRVHAIQVKRNG